MSIPPRGPSSAANPRPGNRPWTPAPEQDGELRYLLLLWHRLPLILVFVVLFLALGVVQLRRANPVWTSTATLKFEPSAGQIVDFGERSSLIYQRDELRTAVQLIRSPRIAAAVLDAIGTPSAGAPAPPDQSPLGHFNRTVSWVRGTIRSLLVSYEMPTGNSDRLREQNRARALLGSLSVNQIPDTKLIEIRVRRGKRDEAVRLCEEFCTQFIDSIHEEKRESLNFSQRFLREQIDETKARLETAEQAVFDFSGEADIRLTEESRELAINNLVEIRRTVEAQLQAVDRLKSEMEFAEELARKSLVTGQVTVLAPLKEQREALEAREATLAAEYEDDYRPLVLVRQQLARIEDQVAQKTEEYVQAAVSSKQLELRQAESRLLSLREREQVQEAALEQIDEKMIQFRVLQREVESTRQIFNALLDQVNRLEVLVDVAPNNVSVVSEASIPTVPSSPSVTRTIGSFAFMGLFTGIAMVLFLQWIDRSVRNPEVIERQLGVPSLAVLPYIRHAGKKRSLTGKRRAPGVLATGEGTSESNAEAFRYLRTSINYTAVDSRNQLLLVTSARPREGKSTVSANLALFSAEQGSRTLLIDGDLKRPSIHRIFEVPRQPGLTDVITSQCELERAVLSSQHENLDVLPAGFSSPSPISLLEGRKLQNLLVELRERYDVIIIDSPPADGIADPLVLSTRVDGVVLVVLQGRTPMANLTRVCQKLHAVGANIIGAVYNNSSPSRSAQMETYKYGYYTRQSET